MKKKMLTRKQLALRWCGVVLALLIAGLWLTPRNLTPEMAHIQQMKSEYGIVTEMLCCQSAQPEGELVLSAAGNTVCLGAYTKENRLTWDSRGGRAVTGEPGRPFAASYMHWGPMEWIGDDLHTEDYCYIFGVLQDDNVEQLRINFRADNGGHDQEIILTEEDWLVTDTGHRYFLAALEPEINNNGRAIYATGYLADGCATQTYWMTGAREWK